MFAYLDLLLIAFMFKESIDLLYISFIWKTLNLWYSLSISNSKNIAN